MAPSLDDPPDGFHNNEALASISAALRPENIEASLQAENFLWGSGLQPLAPFIQGSSSEGYSSSNAHSSNLSRASSIWGVFTSLNNEEGRGFIPEDTTLLNLAAHNIEYDACPPVRSVRPSVVNQDPQVLQPPHDLRLVNPAANNPLTDPCLCTLEWYKNIPRNKADDYVIIKVMLTCLRSTEILHIFSNLDADILDNEAVDAEQKFIREHPDSRSFNGPCPKDKGKANKRKSSQKGKGLYNNPAFEEVLCCILLLPSERVLTLTDWPYVHIVTLVSQISHSFHQLWLGTHATSPRLTWREYEGPVFIDSLNHLQQQAMVNQAFNQRKTELHGIFLVQTRNSNFSHSPSTPALVANQGTTVDNPTLLSSTTALPVPAAVFHSATSLTAVSVAPLVTMITAIQSDVGQPISAPNVIFDVNNDLQEANTTMPTISPSMSNAGYAGLERLPDAVPGSKREWSRMVGDEERPSAKLLNTMNLEGQSCTCVYFGGAPLVVVQEQRYNCVVKCEGVKGSGYG
ncbi:hypothetical protein SERLADRAFT_407597 [Serpula lacrymans var. lacrymans S7.9]|uniref:Uncharacterized protein n=1 Tax=Serpula lacrymans var. lacrymans (strain S7.9) TaxID=578457 RepID=F8NQ67_SERL9|nr:uncharacterized protein SERLADRAFT_407597 [Serpula lacrymans var. lacrymans S7.9]EGO27019.1 hypothetical protein SERLADRAFT_407597 [Serpula lacrymans var. lacrymans S7.9]